MVRPGPSLALVGPGTGWVGLDTGWFGLVRLVLISSVCVVVLFFRAPSNFLAAGKRGVAGDVSVDEKRPFARSPMPGETVFVSVFSSRVSRNKRYVRRTAGWDFLFFSPSSNVRTVAFFERGVNEFPAVRYDTIAGRRSYRTRKFLVPTRGPRDRRETVPPTRDSRDPKRRR